RLLQHPSARPLGARAPGADARGGGVAPHRARRPGVPPRGPRADQGGARRGPGRVRPRRRGARAAGAGVGPSRRRRPARRPRPRRRSGVGERDADPDRGRARHRRRPGDARPWRCTMTRGAAPERPSLVEEHRRSARDRILRAARLVMAERGLATRVDDVAVAAGVGRRTVFRYFESRDALLAAALTDSMRSYGDHIPRPEPERPLEDWLDDALVAIHRMNARHGRVYWELAFARELEGEL